jgi:hypothetical protein
VIKKSLLISFFSPRLSLWRSYKFTQYQKKKILWDLNLLYKYLKEKIKVKELFFLISSSIPLLRYHTFVVVIFAFKNFFVSTFKNTRTKYRGYIYIQNETCFGHSLLLNQHLIKAVWLVIQWTLKLKLIREWNQVISKWFAKTDIFTPLHIACYMC